MKKILFIITLATLPFLLFAGDTTQTNNTISWKSEVNLESNSLNLDFANRMLYGGYINENQKNNWIANLDDNNTLFAEFANTLKYNTSFGDNSLFISFADRNLAKMSFTDDLLKVVLFGNYNYQGDTLNFDNTNFTLDRFQQIKLGYGRTFKIQKNDLKISAAFSYLNGNQHLSFISENATFYTAEKGMYNDLSYDVNAFATDTANFGIFTNNGNGFAFDFSASYQTSNKIFTLFLIDLGYINWDESALKYNTDTSFSFSGFEITDILNFNDSILKDEAEKYLEDIYLDAKKGNAKSYIPAVFGLKMQAELNDHYFDKYETGFNIRWQPHQDNMQLSAEKILQGFYESGYSPYFYVRAFAQKKYALFIPKIAIGGYYQKLSLGLSIKLGKKVPFSIGSNHLESIFNGNESQNLSVFMQMCIKF